MRSGGGGSSFSKDVRTGMHPSPAKVWSTVTPDGRDLICKVGSQIICIKNPKGVVKDLRGGQIFGPFLVGNVLRSQEGMF